MPASRSPGARQRSRSRGSSGASASRTRHHVLLGPEIDRDCVFHCQADRTETFHVHSVILASYLQGLKEHLRQADEDQKYQLAASLGQVDEISESMITLNVVVVGDDPEMWRILLNAVYSHFGAFTAGVEAQNHLLSLRFQSCWA